MQYWRGIVYLENCEEVRVFFCKCSAKNPYSFDWPFHQQFVRSGSHGSQEHHGVCDSETRPVESWGSHYFVVERAGNYFGHLLVERPIGWEKESFEPYYNNYQNMVAQYESSEVGKSFIIFNLEPSKTGIEYWQKCAFFISSKWNNWSSVLLEILLGAPY